MNADHPPAATKDVTMSKIWLMLSVLAGVWTHACSAEPAQQITTPLIHQIPSPWPWGAQVDESAFRPGGLGMTIHAAPNGTATATGTEADPLDLKTACDRLAETLQCVRQGAEALPAPAGLPLWLRMSRRGAVISFSIAPDDQGKPGAWAEIGNQNIDAREQRVAVGLLVSSGAAYPKQNQAAVASIERLRVEGTQGGTPAFAATTIGIVRGTALGITTEGSDGLRITGNGESMRWRAPYGSAQVADHGQGHFTWIAGDFTTEVRVTGLEAVGGAPSAFLSLEARTGLDWKSDRAGVELAVTGTESARKMTVHRIWRQRTEQAGRPARLVLLPGIYRQGLSIPDRDRIGRRLPLVIEGALDQGRTGGVILSGDASEGFEPATWRREADGRLAHELPAAWKGKGKEPPALGITLLMADGTARTLRAATAKEAQPAPGTMRVDAERSEVSIRLPAGMDDAAFASAQVLIARRTSPLLGFGSANNRQDVGENLVLRNLTFQCVAGDAISLQDWMQPIDTARNIVLEDLTVRWNAGRGFYLSHLRDFTLRRITVEQNLGGSWLVGSEGVISDCTWRDNDAGGKGTFWNALRNVCATNCLFTGNDGGWRMDHIGENVLVDRCRFIRNIGRPAMTWETDIGPTTIRSCIFEGNQTRNDGAIALSTTHNVAITGCTFVDNLPAAIAIYPRSRAHTAVKQYDDELCNNLDLGAWGKRNTTSGRWGPGGVKPAAFVRNLVINDCTFRANDAKATFISQERFRRPEPYFRAISEELRAWNNVYWNPAQPLAFLGASRVPSQRPEDGDGYPVKSVDFATWRKQSVHADFEAGSTWGERLTNPITAVTPAPLGSGTEARPQVVDAGLVYRADRLPFLATKPVFAWEHGGRLYHHLQADQVGEFGDRIDYTIVVPEAGTYTLVMDHLQNASPFRYLGFAQVLLDGEPVGRPIDQSGKTTMMVSTPVATLSFSAGQHRLTVASVWRNGYTSGDYDLTIGGFTLARRLPLRPARGGTWAANGLTLQTVSPVTALTLRDVDWTKAQAGPTQPTVGVAVAKPGAQRLEGLLRVPQDGLWTLAATLVGSVEVYLDGELVIDCDGQHWGEKDDPWQKAVTLGLAKGDHTIRIDALVQTGRPLVELRWAAPSDDANRQPELVPAEALGHAP
jgi:hypothetical protein